MTPHYCSICEGKTDYIGDRIIVYRSIQITHTLTLDITGEVLYYHAKCYEGIAGISNTPKRKQA